MEGDPDIPSDDRALEELLRDRRFGPPPPGDLMPWDFLQRWPANVVRQRVWPVVSKLLEDSDPVMRARSVEFVQYWSAGGDETSTRILEIGEREPKLFGDDIVDGETLRDEYARAAATLARGHQGSRLAKLLRKMAADEPLGGDAAAVLAQFEPEFVVAQARRWGRGAGAWVKAAARAMALYRRDDLIDFLEAASGLDRDDRERVIALVESAIERDDGKMAGIARTMGLPTPTRQAPSAAECRKAIGLA